MVGHDAHGFSGVCVIVVGFFRGLLQASYRFRKEVGFIAVGEAVQKCQHSVQTEAGVNVFVFKRLVAVGGFFVLHIDVVADFDVAAATAGYAAMRAARLDVTRIEPLVVRTARSADGAFKLPPVVGFRKKIDVFLFDSEVFEKACGFVVLRRAVVALENGGADFVLIQTENLGQNFKRPGGFLLFEIVAETPVAHHLEKGEVRRVAHAVDVHRANATLHVAKPLACRMRFAEKIRHQRLHTRNVEHNARRSVADKRHRTYIFVSLALIKIEPGFPEFFGCDFHFLSPLGEIIKKLY